MRDLAEAADPQTVGLSHRIQHLLASTDKLQQLNMRRTQLQSMPFQSKWEAGAELGSIVLCAAAGGLSASLHYAFLSLFGVAFWVYRRSTATIRRRQAAQVELADVNVLIHQAARILSEAETAVKEASEITSCESVFESARRVA